MTTPARQLLDTPANVPGAPRFKAAFDLRRDGLLGREAVIALLRDREWTMPGSSATAPLAELFTAYRADRYREQGHSFDQMSGVTPKPRNQP